MVQRFKPRRFENVRFFLIWPDSAAKPVLEGGFWMNRYLWGTYAWVMSHIWVPTTFGTQLATQEHKRHDSFVCVTWLMHLCEITHVYEWHDSFICVTWLIYRHQRSWRPQGNDGRFFFLENVWPDSYICTVPTQLATQGQWWSIFSTQRLHRRQWWQRCSKCVTWLIHMCDMTPSQVCHDSFVFETWLVHTCKMTPSYECLYFLDAAVVMRQWWQHCSTCVTWLIHMCGMTPSYVRHDFFICKMTPSYECVHFFDAAVAQAVVVVTLQYMSHELIHMCVMTLLYVKPDSFIRVTWLLHISVCIFPTQHLHKRWWWKFYRDMRHDSFICVTSPFLYVTHDPFLCVTWLSHMSVCIFPTQQLCRSVVVHVWHDKRDLSMSERDLQKRPTPETYKKDIQKRPAKKTYKKDLQKRTAKETYKKDLQKRPTKEIYVYLNQNVLHVPVICNWCRYFKSDLQKIPTKETSTKETYKSDLKKRPTKATYKREIYERDLRKRPTKETYKKRPMSIWTYVSYMWFRLTLVSFCRSLW